MTEKIPFHRILNRLHQRPQASASIHGSHEHSSVNGCVNFYEMESGVLVAARLWGLPGPLPHTPQRIFGFHIHSGSCCSGTEADPFADAQGHYNPNGSSHPYHAGDMPPLFGNNGFAFQVFYTDRFSIPEILHKTVIIHSGPDDFASQPAGNAGEKIACGRIEAFTRC